MDRFAALLAVLAVSLLRGRRRGPRKMKLPPI